MSEESDRKLMRWLLLAPIIATGLFLGATRLVRLRWVTSVLVSLLLPGLLLLWIIVGA